MEAKNRPATTIAAHLDALTAEVDVKNRDECLIKSHWDWSLKFAPSLFFSDSFVFGCRSISNFAVSVGLYSAQLYIQL